MSEPVFQPLVREDGSLDPSSFERMGEAWIEGWLRERLSGRDPYFPIDARTGEDPEVFVMGLLRQAGPVHPATIAIGRVVLRLLDEARRLASQTPTWLSPLLRLCQQVRLEQTFSWFREELQEIARDSETASRRWGDPRTLREILLAAVAQAPGRPRSSTLAAWLALLQKPDFSSLALAGLGASFEQKLPYLAEWWRHCPPKRRRQELSYLIHRALDQEEPVATLVAQAPPLPPSLRDAINQALPVQNRQPSERRGIMEISNGTGQNTDYRVVAAGGVGQPASSVAEGRRGIRGFVGGGRLASNTFVSVTPPLAPPPWVVEFLRNGVVIARESVQDPGALVVLMQKENGEHKVIVTRHHSNVA